MRIPFVAYDVPAEAPERFCSLNIDNYSGGYQMGRYFKSLGHKRLLCIADNDTFIDHERYQGFCAGSGGADLMQIPMQKKSPGGILPGQFPADMRLQRRFCGLGLLRH